MLGGFTECMIILSFPIATYSYCTLAVLNCSECMPLYMGFDKFFLFFLHLHDVHPYPAGFEVSALRADTARRATLWHSAIWGGA